MATMIKKDCGMPCLLELAGAGQVVLFDFDPAVGKNDRELGWITG
jgi:hypothetical protein